MMNLAENVFSYIWVAVFGLLCGSFGYSIFNRLPKDKSILSGSICDHCGHKLRFFELIPLVSQLFLKSRCRYCGKNIKNGYYQAELLGCCIALAVFLRTTSLEQFFIYYFIWFLLFTNALIDVKHYWLSSYLLIFSLGLGLVELFWLRPMEIYPSILGLLAGSGFFYFVRFVYSTLRGKEALGEGDVTLIGISGLLLKWQALATVSFISSILAITVILGLALKNKSWLARPIPFAIFIVATSFIIWLYKSHFVFLSLNFL